MAYLKLEDTQSTVFLAGKCNVLRETQFMKENMI